MKIWDDYSVLGSVKVTYVRHGSGKRRNNRKGVLVSGINKEGKVCVGWSLCNESEGDVFDKFNGFDKAEDRALLNDRYEKYLPLEDFDDGLSDEEYPLFDLVDDIIPQSIHYDLGRFIDRAKLYYKDADFTDAAEYMNVRL